MTENTLDFGRTSFHGEGFPPLCQIPIFEIERFIQSKIKKTNSLLIKTENRLLRFDINVQNYHVATVGVLGLLKVEQMFCREMQLKFTERKTGKKYWLQGCILISI